MPNHHKKLLLLNLPPHTRSAAYKLSFDSRCLPCSEEGLETKILWNASTCRPAHVPSHFAFNSLILCQKNILVLGTKYVVWLINQWCSCEQLANRTATVHAFVNILYICCRYVHPCVFWLLSWKSMSESTLLYIHWCIYTDSWLWKRMDIILKSIHWHLLRQLHGIAVVRWI